MRIEIKGRKVAVSDELRERVERRFDKIARQVSPLAELEVELSEDPKRPASESQVAEVTLRLKGTSLRAREAASNHRTAVNEAAEDLSRQVKRLKEKRSHRRDAVRPVADAIAPDAI
jgi:putative sigma-54 modulation protein